MAAAREISAMMAVRALMLRDMRLLFRIGGGAGTTLAFFVLVAFVVPLGIGTGAQLFARVGPGILWVALILATLISLEHLFQADYEEGGLDLLLLSPLPLPLVAAAKAAAHWLACVLPLILATPVIALLYSLTAEKLASLCLSMLVGSPALSLMGAIAAALAMGVRRSGLLTALIVVPLLVPVVIFGVIAVTGDPAAATASFLYLGAFSLTAMALAPLVIAAALRLHLD
jgi:heme exporter protein B